MTHAFFKACCSWRRRRDRRARRRTRYLQDGRAAAELPRRLLDVPHRSALARRAAAHDRRVLQQGPDPVGGLVVGRSAARGSGLPGSSALAHGPLHLPAVFLVFFGDLQRRPTGRSAWRLNVPLVVLAVLAIVGGFVELPLDARRQAGTSARSCSPCCRPSSISAARATEMARLQIVAGIVSLAGIYIAWVAVPAPSGRPRRPHAIAGAPGTAPVLVRGLGIRLALRRGLRAAAHLVCDRGQARRDRSLLRRAGLERANGLACAERDRDRPGSLVRGRHHRRRTRHHHDRDVLMILLWLIVAPFVAGVLAWVGDRWSHRWPRWIALAGISDRSRAGDRAVDRTSGTVRPPGTGPWLADVDVRWIDRSSASGSISGSTASACCSSCSPVPGHHVGGRLVDARSQERVGFFHFSLLWVLCRHHRRLPGARSVPVLLLLGTDARPDVFPHRDLGARAPHLRRHRSSSSSRRSADC